MNFYEQNLLAFDRSVTFNILVKSNLGECHFLFEMMIEKVGKIWYASYIKHTIYSTVYLIRRMLNG